MPVIARFKQVWNTFRSATEQPIQKQASYNMGPSTTIANHTPKLRYSSEKSIISSIYTRLSVDVAGVPIRHVIVDDEDRYVSDAKSSLNMCYKLEPNLDQGPRSFRQDIAMTLFDKGVAAIVPVDTAVNPAENAEFEILTMRVGEITAWFPRHIRVSLYNEATGVREEIILEKRHVAIVENPLYSIMNEPNSTLQRLIRKLHLLDAVDEQSSSGKLDLIIQLPYTIKSEARKQQAEKRREEIEFQLKGSRYGIAYTDGTEKVTQLNRPAENNLLTQVQYLTDMVFSQLGLTPGIMSGEAAEGVMINYYARTIEPVLDAIVEAKQRAFLGVMGMMKNERIKYFRDPFKLVPLGNLAEIADKFTRNEIFSSNEFRGFMGIKPSKDPKADQLVNSNMPQPAALPPAPPGPTIDDMDKIMNQVLDGLSSDISKLGGKADG